MSCFVPGVHVCQWPIIDTEGFDVGQSDWRAIAQGFRNIIDNTFVGYIVFNRELTETVDINRAACELLGITKDEIVHLKTKIPVKGGLSIVAFFRAKIDPAVVDYGFISPSRVKYVRPNGRVSYLKFQAFLSAEHIIIHLVNATGKKMMQDRADLHRMDVQFSNFLAVNYYLSPIELKICGLVVRGKTSKTISEKLGLSVYTVNTHRRNIRVKLGAASNKNLFNYLNEILARSADILRKNILNSMCWLFFT